jgi:hypothetical protein
MRQGMARRVLGMLLIGAALAPAGAVAQTLTAEQIVTQLVAHDRERQAALDGYGSQRTYRMEYHGPVGERHAEMVVRMDFTAPDRKHFTVLSESGSSIFCNQVLRRLMEGEQEGALEENHQRAMLSPANYELKLLGTDVVDGANTWVLEVSPRVDSRFTYKGRVWVSMTDFAVVRIVGSPARNPTWLMGSARFDYRYGRSAGEPGEAFWLPERSVTVSHLRIGGEITLTVDYGSYQIAARAGGASTEAVNTGLREHADGQP